MTPSNGSDDERRWASWIEKGRRRDEILRRRMRWLGYTVAACAAAFVFQSLLF